MSEKKTHYQKCVIRKKKEGQTQKQAQKSCQKLKQK